MLSDGRLVGQIGPGDVERWYRRVVEGRADAPAGGATVAPAGVIPPRPDV